jgi:hypothetical protein
MGRGGVTPIGMGQGNPDHDIEPAMTPLDSKADSILGLFFHAKRSVLRARALTFESFTAITGTVDSTPALVLAYVDLDDVRALRGERQERICSLILRFLEPRNGSSDSRS